MSLALVLAVGLVESVRLGMPGYMTLATPFVTMDLSRPLVVLVVQHALVASGCTAARYLLKRDR